MIALLVFYFVSALAYSYLCGNIGSTYSPLATFQVYAIGLVPALAASLVIGRRANVWAWRRLWPPTGPETRAALSSSVILTASTLMYLMPKSMIAILVAQAGCLCLVARPSVPRTLFLPALSIVAVVLSTYHEPLRLALIPIALGLMKTAGYWIKIRSVDSAKQGEGAGQSVTGPQPAAHPQNPGLVSLDDFMAAEQVFISMLALAIASGFSHFAHPAPLTDWRLWAVSIASLGMGLLGTRIMLGPQPSSVSFPAYRMMSLLAAFGASAARGELRLEIDHWQRWIAALLACVVVLTASGALPLLRRWLAGWAKLEPAAAMTAD